MALAPLLPLAHSQLTFKSIYYPYILYCFVIVSLYLSLYALSIMIMLHFLYIFHYYTFFLLETVQKQTTHTVTNFINKVLCFSTRFMCFTVSCTCFLLARGSYLELLLFFRV